MNATVPTSYGAVTILSDHDIRKTAVGEPKSRQEYLAAVKLANKQWKTDNPGYRMMYVRAYSPDHIKGPPIGLVVEVDGQTYGSMCHPNDKWDRELAFHYAVCRSFPYVPPTAQAVANILLKRGA